MTTEMADRVAPLLLDNRPNTYTFTKALAENQLASAAADLPVVIVREIDLKYFKFKFKIDFFY
jgi:fatty acyl-CoA reductase